MLNCQVDKLNFQLNLWRERVGLETLEDKLVHFISICVFAFLLKANNTRVLGSIPHLNISKYLLSKFSLHIQRITLWWCWMLCVCVHVWKRYVSKLMIVSPLHPAYLSSLRVFWVWKWRVREREEKKFSDATSQHL